MAVQLDAETLVDEASLTAACNRIRVAFRAAALTGINDALIAITDGPCPSTHGGHQCAETQHGILDGNLVHAAYTDNGHTAQLWLDPTP